VIVLDASINDEKFKYSLSQRDERNVRMGCGSFNCSCRIDCSSCFIHSPILHDTELRFFSGLKKAHYDQLNEHVFIPLSLMQLRFDPTSHTNLTQTIDRISVEIPTYSAFYNDARKHMSRGFKKHVDNLLTQFNQFNVNVNTANTIVTNRINEIISRAMPGPLSPENTQTLYNMVHNAFCEVIQRTEALQTAFSIYGMTTKVSDGRTGAYAFGNQRDLAINILTTIEHDVNISQQLEVLRNNMSQLRELVTPVIIRSKEISSEINLSRYKGRHRCCPSLIKELWHNLF
jgi:hypothetical protein